MMTDLTITNEELAKAMQAFQLMIVAGREFPAVARYALTKIRRKVEAEFVDYQVAATPVWSEFAAKGEDGRPLREPSGAYVIEDKVACGIAIAPLLAEKVVLSGVRLVALSELGDETLTDPEMEGLMPFIVEEE